MKLLHGLGVQFLLLVAFIFACIYAYGTPNTYAAVTLSDKVVITMANGTTHTFLKSSAVDKGSFTSPAGFTQKNLCATSTLPDMTVCFRPDAGDNRDEIVFEYGTFMKTPTNTGAYTVMIYAGNTALISSPISISNQYFYQRWRWVPQGFRPKYRTVAQLEAARLIPPYRTGVDPQSSNDSVGNPDPRFLTYTPMPPTLDEGSWPTVMGVLKGMGITGERDDLGPVTAPQGNYLISQREDWWKVVQHQAEVSGSIPWNIRDEGGTPINFYRSGVGILDRTLLTWHSNSWGANYNLDNHTNNNTGWQIDSSHQPALNYLPWLLTGDPYYLEGLQFQSSSNVMYTNWGRNSSNLHAVMSDQLRGNAWNLRNLLGLAISTPDSVPGWLNPRSYYLRASKENAAESIANYVNNKTDPLITVLQTQSYSFWQQDFFTTIAAWATWSGLTEWKPVYDFAIQNPIARVNGTSGWERRCPTVYNWGTPDFRAFVPPNPTSWAHAWSIELANNHPVVPADTSLLCGVGGYTSYLLGTLALATHIGTPNAESYYRWLSDAMKITLKSMGGGTQGPKWDIAPTYMLNGTIPPPVPPPSTTPPPPPPPPASPTATISASPISITSGQSTMLNWGSTNAMSCAGTNFTANSVAGALSLQPNVTTTYSITCTGTGGSASASVQVLVGAVSPPPPPPSTTPPPTTTNCLNGTGGNDTLTAIQSTTCIDGGAGTDAAKLTYPTDMPASWVVQTTNSDGSVTVVDIHATGYTITLRNIETIIFPSGETRSISSNTAVPTSPPPPPPSVTPTTPPPPPPTTSSISIGSRVKATANLNVRNNAGTSATRLCVQRRGALGTVTAGPKTANGYTWWQVNFDSRCDGWAVRNYLTTSLALVTDEDTEIAYTDTPDREAQLAAAIAALEGLLKKIQELMNR